MIAAFRHNVKDHGQGIALNCQREWQGKSKASRWSRMRFTLAAAASRRLYGCAVSQLFIRSCRSVLTHRRHRAVGLCMRLNLGWGGRSRPQFAFAARCCEPVTAQSLVQDYQAEESSQYVESRILRNCRKLMNVTAGLWPWFCS